MTTVVTVVVVVVVVVDAAPFPTRATVLPAARLKDPAGESDPPVLRDGWMDGWIDGLIDFYLPHFRNGTPANKILYSNDDEGRLVQMSDMYKINSAGSTIPGLSRVRVYLLKVKF
jgi:hypothetical protein